MLDQFLFILNLFNPFGSSKGFFQKIRSYVKFFWHPCYYFFNTAKLTLICEKAMVFMYSNNIRSVFFSTWKWLNRNISFQIYDTQSRIFILKGYFITLLYFSFCIQLWTFNLFCLSTWFFKRRIAHFALLHASIVRSLICEKKVVFMYFKIVYTPYLYQLSKSWTVLFNLPNL